MWRTRSRVPRQDLFSTPSLDRPVAWSPAIGFVLYSGLAPGNWLRIVGGLAPGNWLRIVGGLVPAIGFELYGGLAPAIGFELYGGLGPDDWLRRILSASFWN